MSLVWLVLMGNTPAIVATLICLQTMKFLQQTGFGDSKSSFGGLLYHPYMMGLGQGNHTVPTSWIQLSSVMFNVYKQLGMGTNIHDRTHGQVPPLASAITNSATQLRMRHNHKSGSPQCPNDRIHQHPYSDTTKRRHLHSHLGEQDHMRRISASSIPCKQGTSPEAAD
jgi:hypothetical protein